MGERAAIGVIQLAARAAGLGQRDDGALLADFLDRRDSAAFEAIVRRHGPLVLAACRQVLRDEAAAEDAFQATFVILHQKARSIRRQPSLGGWLFRVARRTALRARRAADRRTRHETKAPQPRISQPDLSWHEAVAILHEELDRLPATYRDALIHCYLEGLSRDEAARRLGWTVNELRGRLERGRSRLRAQLERRGLTLSAGLLAAVAIESIPTSLVAATTRTVAEPAARIAELAAAGWGKVRLASAVALAAAIAIGIGLVRDGQPVGAQTATPIVKQQPAKSDAPANPDERIRLVSGKVLDPNGKEVAGAKVWVIDPWRTHREVGKTADDGTFRIELKKDAPEVLESEWIIRIAATHEKHGIALPASKPGEPLVLRLAQDDVPIRGRILDLQGKPVAGVRIAPYRVQAAASNSLDGWLTKLKAAEDQVNLITDGQLRRKVDPAPGLPTVTTDDKGRFTLTGVGRERLVHCRLDGPTIARTEIAIMTRAGKDVRVQYDLGNVKLCYRVFYGATFDFAADPAQPFTGVVTDKTTGKPIPKAVIRSTFPHRIEAVADEEGKYMLRGLGPGVHRLIATPPAGEPFLPLLMEGGRANNEKPVTLDFALTRAEWVEGVVIDARSKKPVAAATISYSPLGDEAVRNASGDITAFDEPLARTDADGKFRIPAYPGAGAIIVNCTDRIYISALSRPLQGDSLFWTLDGVRARWTRLFFSSFEALAIVEFDPKKPRTYTITVDPGETIKGRILDLDGKPLDGARASRLTEYHVWTMKPLGVEFEAEQMQSTRTRSVLFWHEERKLGTVWRPKVGDPSTYDAMLRPNATATGRLLDKEENPKADYLVDVLFRVPGDPGWAKWFPQPTVRTDANGRFEVSNLPAGVEFNVRTQLRGAEVGRYWNEFQLKSGQTKDLGDIKPR